MKLTQLQFATQLAEATHAAVESAKNAPQFLFPCGGAWISIAGNSPLIRAFKKYGVANGDTGVNQRYEFAASSARPSCVKGYIVRISTCYRGQSMTVETQAMDAACEVLRKYGHKVSTYTYID
jgi:hypothetical protein